MLPGDNMRKRFDPKHPALLPGGTFPLKTMPTSWHSVFTLRAVPKATLWKPEATYPPPPACLRIRPEDEQVDMSLLKYIGPKSVHRHAVVRNRIGRKLKQAISLIVAHGAQAGVDEHGNPTFTLNREDAGRSWVLKGTLMLHAHPHHDLTHYVDWTYVIIPKLEVYSMPMPLLVSELRLALDRIRKKAHWLKKQWGPYQSRVSFNRPPIKLAKGTSKTSASISEPHDTSHLVPVRACLTFI